MSDLVARLSDTDHPVEVGGPNPTPGEFRRRLIELEYVFIRFPDTVGGTELGVSVDPTTTDLSAADFESASGVVHVEGTLSLDFEDVRCVSDIDLATLRGRGRLVVVAGSRPVA